MITYKHIAKVSFLFVTKEIQLQSIFFNIADFLLDTLMLIPLILTILSLCVI